MKKHTVKATLAAIRAIGCTASHRNGEYRVNLKGAGEGPAYYTDDAEDAIGTARALIGHATTAAAQVDFRVQDHGSIVMLEPVSEEAKHFVQAFVSVPDYAWHGRAFAVEHRYADNLLSGIIGNGLIVA